MKHLLKFVSVLVLIIGMSSCTEEELVLLENVPMFSSDGKDRLLARPESVMVTGEPNHIIRVRWPNIAPNISSASVVIERDGFSKAFDVKSFVEDFEFLSGDLSTYKVTVYYNSTSGLKSKVSQFNVAPRDTEVDLIAQEVKVTPMEGAMEFIFKSYLKSEYTYKLGYSYAGKEVVKEFQSSTKDADTLVLEGLLDDLHIYSFNIQVLDKINNVSSTVFQKQEKPLIMPFMYVYRNLKAYTSYNETIVEWNNNTGKPVTVHLVYTAGGQERKISKTSLFTTDKLVTTAVPPGSQVVKVYTESAEGLMSEQKLFTVNPIALELFSTKVQKVGWQVAVSSNQANDGGGGPALIDGDNATFWHTPWSGTVPNFPHSATITFPTTYTIMKVVLRTRAHSTPNSPKDFDVQTSQNGVDFVTRQSFTNTVNTGGTDVSFVLTQPVETKYIRLVFKTSLSNTAYMNLSEISFEGVKGQ